jgi:RNA polymerase sigma factor (sigma-70 family)
LRAPSMPWSSGVQDKQADVDEIGQPEANAIRSWLVGGARWLAIDPRRSRGRHRQARQLLAENGTLVATMHDRWSGFVSALQRHTVHSALARLDERERQVLTLAYLQGHTNREIAAMLSVSVSTVGRRLSAALESLEHEVWRAGTWVSVIVFLGVGHIFSRTVSFQRLASTVRSAGWPDILALSAAGAATAIALGVVVAGHDSPAQRQRATQASASPHQFGSLIEQASPFTTQSLLPPSGTIKESGQLPRGNSKTRQTDHSAAGTRASTDPGCDGNPTNAPPAVPVGSRSGHPAGAPITHPTAGGCGPHGAEVS